MWFVSIILLNYNWRKFNISCIASILKQGHRDFEIIFVDNASTDWSLEEVEKAYGKEVNDKKIIIVKNKTNTWFAWGNNLWIQYASSKSKYICLLNNDTIVDKNWLLELTKWIESDRNLWAVGSLILDEGHEDEIKKQIFEDKKKFMLSVFWETVIEPIEKWELESWILYTNGLSGCCVMYKKWLIEKPFEDYYFAYAEDVYLSRKILLTGYSLWMCINSTINHFWSWSFGKSPSKVKLFNGNKNQIINFLLFYSTWTKIKLFPLFLLIQIWHLFINMPWERLKAKVSARGWIIKNYWEIKHTKLHMKSKINMTDRVFIRKLYSKFNDETYCAKFSKTKLKLIKNLNLIFKLYIWLLF